MTAFVRRLLVTSRSWLRSSRVDRDFDEELEFHLEREIEANQAAGVSPGEARRTAHLALGGISALHEQSRDERPGEGVRRVLREIDVAARYLARDRGYTFVVVTTMALAIAAVAVIFAAMRTVVFDPVPGVSVDRMVVAWDTNVEKNFPVAELTYRDARAFIDRSESFASAAAMGSAAWSDVLERDGDRARVAVRAVTPEFFATLGVAPQYGRVFEGTDNLPHAPGAVVLSHALWERRFAGNSAVVGTTVNIGAGSPYRIVGVMPPGFDFPERTDVWIPVVPALVGDEADPTNALTTVGALFLLARLREDVSPLVARDELQRIADAVRTPIERDGAKLTVQPLTGYLLGPVRPMLWALLASVLILLVIGCSSIAALMLTRSARRAGEDAVRVALGASLATVGRFWLWQSLLLCAAAGIFGWLLSAGGIAVVSAFAPDEIPRLRSLAPGDLSTWSAFGLPLLTALLCGLVPMRHAAAHTTAGLGGGRHTPDERAHRFRSLLLATQAGFTLVLLVCAGMLVRSYTRLSAIDLGFVARDVLTVHVEPRDPGSSSNIWMATLIERLAERSEIDAVGAISHRPLVLGAIGDDSLVVLEGETDSMENSWRHPVLNYQVATPGYFDVMRIPLREGRLFGAEDTAVSPRVGLVGESTARRLWPNQSPLGRKFLLPARSRETGREWRTVVGVVADVRYRGLNDVRLDVYDLASQTMAGASDVVLRSRRDHAGIVSIVREETRGLDPAAAIDGVASMEDLVARARAPWRLGSWILVTFGAMASLMTAVGLFGAVSLDAAARRRELAIRLALGESRAAIVRALIVGTASRIGPGLAGGILCSLAAGAMLRSVLFEVSTIDPVTYLAIGGVMSALVLSATIVPALAATTQIEPGRLQ